MRICNSQRNKNGGRMVLRKICTFQPSIRKEGIDIKKLTMTKCYQQMGHSA